MQSRLDELSHEADMLLLSERSDLISENEMLRKKLLDARIEIDELADEVDQKAVRIAELIEENEELIEENDKLLADLDYVYEHVDELNDFINVLMGDDVDE